MINFINPIGLILPLTIKPNRITDTKNEDYHIKMARWIIFMANNDKHRNWIMRREINKNFYTPNRQWFMDEDMQSFLMDTSGQNTTRIKTEYNLINIMGNMYIGNANKMKISAKCNSFSPLSATRRETSLQQMIYWTEIAKNSPAEYADYLKSRYPIGDTIPETEGIFSNLYVDEYVKSINSLLRYGAVVNKFDEKAKALAEDLFISGACVIKPYTRAGEYRFKHVRAERFFFDHSAKAYDLSDAGFMGEWDLAMPTDIYEQYPNMSYDARMALENYVTGNTTTWSVDGRVAVYKVCWRDVVVEDYGYVEDASGNIYFTRLNFKDYTDKPTYTEKDCVDVSRLNKYQKGIVKKDKGKAFVKKYCDQWRYCDFIPSELVGGYAAQAYQNKIGNIMLDYGVVEFQETDLYSTDNMLPPYKFNAYMYVDGEIFSPVDIAINPQRMVNRIFSVVENMMNNSTGAGTAYDPDMVENEAEFLMNMKQNKPVAIRTKGMGINNVIMRYDNTPSQGMNVLANFAQMFAQQIESITGVNSASKGQIESADQLVGVTQLMIKRGSIVQERFYDALDMVYLDCYQNLASAGKRFYIQNQKELIDMTGDEGATVLTLSEDLNSEDFRCEIFRSLAPEDERKQVDTMILNMLQIGFLDRTSAANLLGRAYEEDLWSAVRQYAKQANIVAAAQEQQGALQQEAMTKMAMLQQQEEQQGALQQQMLEQKNKDADREVKQQGNLLNAASKIHNTEVNADVKERAAVKSV